MKKRKERKKGILQQRRISCEETFLNNSNPTAHVHCKILSIRTNQTHLHRPSFFQRISKIYPPFEISLHRKKKKREEKSYKFASFFLLFSPRITKEDFSTISNITSTRSLRYREKLGTFATISTHKRYEAVVTRARI